MAEISRTKPSESVAFMAVKGHKGADLCALDDRAPTFRDAVRQAHETAKRPEVKKQTQSDSHTMRKPETVNCDKPQSRAPEKPAIKNVESDKKEPLTVKESDIESLNIMQNKMADLQVVAIDPKMQITQSDSFTDEDELEDVLSDLDLIENVETDDYTADHYTVSTAETEEPASQDESEVIIFSNTLQIATPIKTQNITNNESALNDECQNQTTSPDVQPVQPGVSRQNMHESSERHINEEKQPNNAQPDLELSIEEQKVVDAFVRATESFNRTKSQPMTRIVETNKDITQAEMKRVLVVPMQLVQTSQDDTAAHASLESDTLQADPLSSVSTTRSDKGNQESMNFSQFFGSSSDMKNMAENSKVATHNLVSANPAAEFIETLKQNVKQFGKAQTSKLTVQMRHSGKNLTIHFNTDSDQVMNVTFRTTDTDWKNMLQEHSKEIEDVFEDSQHTVNIKYLGE